MLEPYTKFELERFLNKNVFVGAGLETKSVEKPITPIQNQPSPKVGIGIIYFLEVS
jgi:hypothetical protein